MGKSKKERLAVRSRTGFASERGPYSKSSVWPRSSDEGLVDVLQVLAWFILKSDVVAVTRVVVQPDAGSPEVPGSSVNRGCCLDAWKHARVAGSCVHVTFSAGVRNVGSASRTEPQKELGKFGRKGGGDWVDPTASVDTLLLPRCTMYLMMQGTLFERRCVA